jgi:hypothetical protein
MNYLNCTPSPQSQSTALLDSECTENFLLAKDQCRNKLLTETPLQINLPNGATIASTHNVILNLPSLPHATRQVHIFPGLDQQSLITVRQMCDSGCAVTFTSRRLAVKNDAAIILTGQRDKEPGLWRAPLGNSISTQAAPGHYAHTV